MPDNNIIDILNQQTARDAREYSMGYNDISGLPSVVQQVNDIERERTVSPFKSYTPQQQAINRGNYEYYSQISEELNAPEDYGKTRKDETWTSAVDIANLEDRRARQQSGAEQLANGISKGVVIAGTTFVDGIAGTAAGIVNLAWQAAKGDIERPADALYAFIDNPISKQLQSINEWAEKVMPNYYTDEQRNAKWYNPVNLFSANFVGDKFLKNTGFMLGAAYSGRVNAGVMSKAIAKKELRDAFKGVVKNAAGTKEFRTAAEIYKAYKTGDAFMDGVKLTKDLANQARQIRNQEWGLKLLGSMAAAAGEARIEAISNTEDYTKRMQQMIDADREDAISRVYDEVIARNGDGNKTYDIVMDQETGRAVPVFTPLGESIANEMMGKIEERYQQANIELQKNRAVMANQIFGLNMLVLTGTDLFTFGRFIAGGYNTNRGAKDLLKGSIEKGYKESTKNRNKDIAKAIMVPIAEGPYEEMMQASISTGAGYHASANMNRFYGYKIDSEAEDDAVNSVNAILEGIRDTYSDINQWEQGAIGALSSILGIPGFVEARDEKGNTVYEEVKDENGRTHYKPKKKFSMQGEFWDSIRDVKEDRKKSKEAAIELNEIVSKPEFVEKWRSYIRHKKLDVIKENALKNGNPFEYKNADEDQIISDIIAFDKAGRIQDLYDLIDENENITLNDVESIRNATTDRRTNESVYDGKTDEEVIDGVKKHAKKFRDEVDKYVKIREDIRNVYGPDMNDEHAETLTWAYMTINNAEDRIKEISSELIPKLNDIFHVFSAITGEDIGMDINNLNDLYRFTFNGDAREKFIKAIGSNSARNLSEEKLLKFIFETLQNRDAILEMMERKDLSDKERETLKVGRENAFESYWKAMNLLNKIQKDPSLHPISDLEMNDVRTKMSDLVNLIAYKTEFLNMLAKLTTNPGAFNKDVIQLNKKRQEERDQTEAQKLYDSIDEEMSQNDFNKLLATGIHNENQQNKVFNLLKNSSKPKIKEMYKVFDNLNSALNSLSSASTLNEDDANLQVKGMVNSVLDDLLEKNMPASTEELSQLIDEAANTVDNPVAYDYAESLKNSIEKSSNRKKAAEDAVKEQEAKEQPKQGLEIVGEEDPITKAFGPEGGTQVTEEPKVDSSNGVSDPNEINRVVEETISNLSIDELNGIIDRNEIPSSINGKIDLESIKVLAKFYKDKKDGSLGGDTGIESSGSLTLKLDQLSTDQEDNGKPKTYPNTDGVVLNGLGVTGVNFKLLKDGLVKKYVDINDSVNKIVDILNDDFNTFNFLDSGALASIEKFYISQGKTTPIKFVFANKNEGRKYEALHSLGKKGNDLYNILLAVEITDDIRNSLENHQKDQLREVDIDGKSYQIVGQLKRLGDSDGDYEAYQQIYNVNIASIDEQREKNPEQDLFVGNYRGLETSTSINKIYTGRRPVAKTGVSIKSVMDTALDGNVYFGCAVVGTDGLTTIFSNKPDGVTFRDPSNIGVNITPGMVFAFTKTPDDAYAYIPITMATSDEIDFSEDNRFVNILKDAVSKLTDPNTTEIEKTIWKVAIMRTFRIGKTPFYFRKDELNVFHFDGKIISSWDDFVNAITAKQYRTQFDRREITDSSSSDAYVKDLIDANVMKINYESLHSYGSSFTVNALGKNGRPVEVKRSRIQQVRKKYTVPQMNLVISDGPNNNYQVNDTRNDDIIDLNTGQRVTDPMTLARIKLSAMIHYGANGAVVGLPVSEISSDSVTLYNIDPSPDGKRPRMFLFRNFGSKILQTIDEQTANELKDKIIKENRIKQARENAQSTNGLKIFEGDDAKVPEKAAELTTDDLKHKSDTTTQTEKESPSKPSSKPSAGESIAATRTDADVSIVNTEITDRDRELAKKIKDNKWKAAQIEKFFANQGIHLSLNKLNKTAMAQVINKTFDDNPEVNMDMLEAEIHCGAF